MTTPDLYKDLFWKIQGVTSYETFYDSAITDNEHFSRSYALVKNLSYNSQYLEFISKVQKIEIHASLRMEFYKTWVIIGVSIIESLLYYLLKSKGLHKQNYWKVHAKITSNEKQVEEAKLKVETTILKFIDEPVEEEMSLDSMLKKTETHLLLGKEKEIYKQLNHLRKLRNKIHLYIIEEHLDTDWNSFSTKEYQLIKGVLQSVFFSEIFKLDKKKKKALFYFLD